MTWQEFEVFARARMSREFDTELVAGGVSGVPKKFDMLSRDSQVVGDAKYLTLVRGERIPPAKFMEVAGRVWLLGRVAAERRFLVFRNQREVPEAWLRKYGVLVGGVEFYFSRGRRNARSAQLIGDTDSAVIRQTPRFRCLSTRAA